MMLFDEKNNEVGNEKFKFQYNTGKRCPSGKGLCRLL